MKEALITMITVPFALIGGIFMVYFMGLIYRCRCSRFYCTVWDGDRNSYDNDYLNEAMNKMVEKYGNSSETITTDILRQYIIDGSAKAEAKINDGFSFSIWISTHSLGNRERALMIPLRFRLLRNNHLCYICIISNLLFLK
jgi:hypothetical protein